MHDVRKFVKVSTLDGRGQAREGSAVLPLSPGQSNVRDFGRIGRLNPQSCLAARESVASMVKLSVVGVEEK